jgi:hypothetical protein
MAGNDPVEERRELRPRLPLGRLPEDVEERLLHDISRRIRVPQHPVRMPQRAVLVAFEQLRESARVAAPAEGHEFLVGHSAILSRRAAASRARASAAFAPAD